MLDPRKNTLIYTIHTHTHTLASPSALLVPRCCLDARSLSLIKYHKKFAPSEKQRRKASNHELRKRERGRERKYAHKTDADTKTRVVDITGWCSAGATGPPALRHEHFPYKCIWISFYGHSKKRAVKHRATSAAAAAALPLAYNLNCVH